MSSSYTEWQELVTVIWYRGYDERRRDVRCGQSWDTVRQYCSDCYSRLAKQYPQGWRYYAGDKCKHGVYVGGMGADYMCMHCELGDDLA